MSTIRTIFFRNGGNNVHRQPNLFRLTTLAIIAVLVTIVGLRRTEAAVTIETLVQSRDNRPGSTTEIYAYLDQIQLFDDGDVIFAAGAHLLDFNSNNFGLFLVTNPGIVQLLSQIGDPPFEFATALPPIDRNVRQASRLGFAANVIKTVIFTAAPLDGLYRQVAGNAARRVTCGAGSDELRASGFYTLNNSGAILTVGNCESEPAGVLLIDGPTRTIIAVAGDPVPGIPDATFSIFNRLIALDDGNNYFEAVFRSFGTTINSNNNRAFYRGLNGTLTLLVRRGDPAPGLPGFNLQPDLLLAGDNGQILISGLAFNGAGTVFDALFLGTGPGDLAPILKADSSGNEITSTTSGAVAFTSLGTSVISRSGDVYFVASGTLISVGASIGGIWRYSNGTISLVVPPTGEFHSFVIRDINSNDEIAFSVRLGLFATDTGIWVTDSLGTTTKVIQTGDSLEGKAIQSLDFQNVHINNAGEVAFVAGFGGSVGSEDAGIFLATLGSADPDATDNSTAGQPQAGTDQDPVNTFSGELFNEYVTDLNLGGPMPLTFKRYYASYLRRSFILGDLGSNWQHNFDARLFISGNTGRYISNKGRVTNFVKDLNTGDWEQQDNLDTPYQLSLPGGQDATFYDPVNNRIYTFDFTNSSVIIGKLVKIEDGNGNAHTLTYNDPTNAQLVSVSDGLGRTLTFTYNNDLIPKIVIVTDGTRSVNFQYTDAIDSEYLTQVTDARGGSTTYTYEDTSANADHALMRFMTRPRGNTPFIQTFFDITTAASGRVATQTDSDGNTFSFDYNGLETTLTDPLGNTRVHTHTATGEFSNRQDQTGQSFSMGSDATGRRNSITDRLGDTTSYNYDEPSGKIDSVTNADGTTTSYFYTARVVGGVTINDLTGINHADGTTQSLGYDAMGNTTSHIDQMGNTATATYNANGQPLATTNVAGGTTTHTYNPDGTRASITDPAGNTTTFGYDSSKRFNLITLADGTTHSFTYSNLDQILTTADGNGNTTTLGYDANGNMATIADPLGNTRTYTYDGNDRLLTVVDPRGNTISRTYHPLGRIETQTDENGNTTTFAYDILTRFVSTTDPLGNAWSRTYDAEATLTSITDPLGKTTLFTSDAMGRVTQTTTPLESVFGVTYDAMGRVSTETDPLGNTTTFTRDPRGLLSGIIMPGGGISTSYVRDNLGNITAITDPSGKIWRRGYDTQGQRISRTDPLGNTVQTVHDSRGNPSVITFPGVLGTVTMDYDANNNPTRSVYSDGTTLNYTHDANNRLTAADGITRTYDAGGHIIETNGIAVTRDPGGRITSMTLAAGKTVTYTYDANDNLTQVTDWLGGISSFSYDAARRLTSMTRPNLVTTVNTYDDDNRLIGIDEETISSIGLTRDAKGQITGATRVVPLSATAGGVAASAHTYDAASQVSGFTYDGHGRLTDDGDRTYVWDLASRLTSITDGGATTSFTYAASGHRLSRTVSGTTRGYVWNYALRLPSVSIETQMGSDFRYYVHTPKGELLYSIDAATNARRFHHFDEMGNTIFLTDDAGAVTDSYAYTPYGNLTNSMGGYDNSFTWQGREGVMDEGNGLYYMRARYYDAKIARFISRDQILLISPKEINPYQYATNNPLKYQDPWGLRIDYEYIAAVVDIALHALAERGGIHGTRIAGPIANVLVTGYVAKKTLDSVFDSTKDFKWKIDQAEQIEWIKITKGDYSYEDHYRSLGFFAYADCDYRSDAAVDRRNEIRKLLRLEALYKIGAEILDNDPVKDFYTGLDLQKMPDFLDAEPKHVARALELGFKGNKDWFAKSDFNKIKKSWW